jgi:hypothetical protein
MNCELMHIQGKGLCIVISDFNPNDFGSGLVNGQVIPFTNVNAIAAEIRLGRKIAAIKELRSQTGWGLKESKEYIDKYTDGIVYNRDGVNHFANDRAADRFIQAHTPATDLLGEDEFKV